MAQRGCHTREMPDDQPRRLTQGRSEMRSGAPLSAKFGAARQRGVAASRSEFLGKLVRHSTPSMPAGLTWAQLKRAADTALRRQGERKTSCSGRIWSPPPLGGPVALQRCVLHLCPLHLPVLPAGSKSGGRAWS
jgi:hypothetical protein